MSSPGNLFNDYVLPAATGVKNTVANLFSPQDMSGLPYEAQAAALAKRQKMAELLMQQGQAQPEVMTYKGIAAQPSMAGGLGRALSQFMGAYMGGKAEEDAAALSKAETADALAKIGQIYKLPDTTGLVPSAEPAGTTPTPYKLSMPTFTENAKSGQPTGSQDFTANLNMPNMPGVTTATIPSAPRPYAEQQQMLNEFALGGNRKLAAMAPVLAAQLKPEYFAGSEYGNYSRDAAGNITNIIPSTPKNTGLGAMGEAQMLLSKLTPGTQPYIDTQNYIKKLNAMPVGTVINTGEKSLKNQLGTNVANALETSATQAQSAVKTLGVISNIRNALSTGKVITGPGTTARQIFLQISGNNPDALAQTRQVVQGLAQLTLNSRGLLKGQGQVSDKEGALLEKAQSGSIDSLTGPEILTVVDVIERQGKDAIKLNKTYVQRAKKGDVFDFFDVDEPAPTSGVWTGRQ